jgi:hypothetical protein
VIIGFSGPAGAGKSTAAKYLMQEHGFRLVKFAGPLKAMMRALLPEDDQNEWLEGALKETVHPDLGCTPRHAMQTLGTEWGRNCIHPDLWINLARSDILDGGDDVVLDDVRFQNEYEMIKAIGGLVIEIRPKAITHRMSHASEIGCDKDYVLYNDGSLSQLYQSLALIMISSAPSPGKVM